MKINRDIVINYIKSMSSNKFTKSKNAIQYYVFNQGFIYSQLAKKFDTTEQDLHALSAIVGSPQLGICSLNNYAWTIQGDINQTNRWIKLYFKS